MKNETLNLLTFRISNIQIGIETRYVNESCSLGEYTPLPGVPKHLLGLINFRRSIVPVIDLRPIFNGWIEEGEQKSLLIILKSNLAEFAILCDALGKIEQISRELKPLPEKVAALNLDFLLGISEENTIIMDGEKLFSSPKIIIDQQNGLTRRSA